MSIKKTGNCGAFGGFGAVCGISRGDAVNRGAREGARDVSAGVVFDSRAVKDAAEALGGGQSRTNVKVFSENRKRSRAAEDGSRAQCVQSLLREDSLPAALCKAKPAGPLPLGRGTVLLHAAASADGQTWNNVKGLETN